MELLQWGTDPWGQETLVRVGWDVLYLFFWAGIAFIVFHLIYAAVWLPKLAAGAAGSGASPTAAETAAAAAVPEKIVRHTGVARIFHWVMAGSMLTLLVTGFFPVVGVQFAWLTVHWISGILLTVSILFHIIHSTFYLDFWSIWIGPRDIGESIKRMRRQLGHDVAVPKHGKYPLDHKLYHFAVMVAGLVVIGTGAVMMFRIEQPLFQRNSYLLTDETWGLVYVAHGMLSALFVMLTLTHIYFAVRPDKIWLTKAMITGKVDRDHFLGHHDPTRWVVQAPTKPKPPHPASGPPVKPTAKAAAG